MEDKRITQFNIDIIDDNYTSEQIAEILENNGIKVVGIANDYGWNYKEYFNIR